eukprot:428083-Alexandrium_andersonii.AAC.1
MSASLVGSEMCIRDRGLGRSSSMEAWTGSFASRGVQSAIRTPPKDCPVSYTHLTLPTICSV